MLPILFSDVFPDEKHTEILRWLENCLGEPWNEIEKNWMVTLKERLQHLYNSPGKLQDYLDKFSVLKGPKGAALLQLDLEYLFPDQRGDGYLQEAIVAVLPKLVEVAKTKQKCTRDVWLKTESLKLLNSIESK